MHIPMLQIITVVALIIVGIVLYKLHPRIPLPNRNAVEFAVIVVAALAAILVFLVPNDPN